MSEVSIGTRAEEDIEAESVYDDPIVLASAWRFLKPLSDSKTAAAVESILASGASAKTAPKPSRVTVPEWVLKRHALIFGKPGYGKSSLALRLISEQLERGCSLVAIDRDASTLNKLRAACYVADIPPKRLFIIDADQVESAPGFNPLIGPGKPGVLAARLADYMVSQMHADNGERMYQYLLAALTVAVWHRLDFRDIPRILLEEPFREDVLGRDPFHASDSQYVESVRYFRTEFTKARGGDRDSSALAVSGRFLLFNNVPIFQTMLNARENSLDLATFFEEPSVLLAYVSPDSGLNERSRSMLAGLLVNMLGAVKERDDSIPVILSIDEVGDLINHVRAPIMSIARTARKRNIRMLLSTQAPSDLQGELEKAVMNTSSFKAYFQMDHSDLYAAASLLAAGEEEEDRAEYRVTAGQETVIYEGPVLSERAGDEGLLQLETWDDPPAASLVVDTRDPGKDLRKFAEYGLLAEPPLMFGDFVASEIIQDLPPGSVKLRWAGDYPPKYAEARIAIPVVVAVPDKKKQRPVDRWLKALKSAPIGRAVVVVGTEKPDEVQIDWQVTMKDAPADYVAAARRLTAAPPYVPPPVETKVPKVTEPPAPKPEPPAPKLEPKNANLPPTEDIRGTFEE